MQVMMRRARRVRKQARAAGLAAARKKE